MTSYTSHYNWCVLFGEKRRRMNEWMNEHTPTPLSGMNFQKFILEELSIFSSVLKQHQGRNTDFCTASLKTLKAFFILTFSPGMVTRSRNWEFWVLLGDTTPEAFKQLLISRFERECSCIFLLCWIVSMDTVREPVVGCSITARWMSTNTEYNRQVAGQGCWRQASK